ncbi:hypothetical protein LSAT2_021066, partial [Lamellibrachia satsuma]
LDKSRLCCVHHVVCTCSRLPGDVHFKSTSTPSKPCRLWSPSERPIANTNAFARPSSVERPQTSITRHKLVGVASTLCSSRRDNDNSSERRSMGVFICVAVRLAGHRDDTPLLQRAGRERHDVISRHRACRYSSFTKTSPRRQGAPQPAHASNEFTVSIHSAYLQHVEFRCHGFLTHLLSDVLVVVVINRSE